MANTTSAAPSISAHTAATARSSTASAAGPSPSQRAGRPSSSSHPRLRVRSMAGSDAGRSPSPGATAKTAGPPSVSANTTRMSASGPKTTGSDRPVNRHVPSLSRRPRTASGAPRPGHRAGGHHPMTDAAPRWRRRPHRDPWPRRRRPHRPPVAAANAPWAMTVPAKGTGARWRPSCSHNTATSTRPSPRPPSSEERSTACHPWSAMADHRWSIEMTIGVGHLTDAGRSEQASSRRLAAASRSAT